jgi:amidohydrolase
VTSALPLPGNSSLTSAWPETPAGADPLPGQLDRWLASRGAELVAVRRHLHAHPELSFQEFATAELVARELKRARLDPQMLPDNNGVICDIGTGDRVIALHATLDALPLSDSKDVPYRSTVDGVCHAGGHDVETTVLLGAGLALAQLAERGELPGRVRLLFQPGGANVPSGAAVMIANGAMRDVSSVYALRCEPMLPAGLVAVRSGPFAAAADKIEARITGRGGHTARPHLTADVVFALGRVIVDVPALLDRRVDARTGVSMVWGEVHAGDAANTVPGEGVVRGMVRILHREASSELPEVLTELVRSAVAGTGADVEVTYVRGMPSVVNDRLATAIIAGAAGAALGPARVAEAEISMVSDDFGSYLVHAPGSVARLGCRVPGSDRHPDIHQPSFDVDERAIGYGVRVMVHTALAAVSAGAL